ncbi:hypothetical protein VQL36_08930 [Chengkuizengella sp. SCS-71B]|uniref:hypothetical protein n=1 Tax=Chengkuizengella sp. SCS-71B TaxID=3115290 RepID=UPI0032C248D1
MTPNPLTISKDCKRKILSTGALSPNSDIGANYAHLAMINRDSKVCNIIVELIQWTPAGNQVLTTENFNIPGGQLRTFTFNVMNIPHYEMQIDKTNASKNCIVNTFAIESDMGPPKPAPGYTFLESQLIIIKS